MICPSCGHDVPSAPFCVLCGAPLENEASPYPHERRGYAAAPHEHWFAPHVVSTLFPHLPRSDLRGFRIALAAGAGLILGLCLFSLFPLALIVAAVLVPFLTVVYLWDVDLYEDAPLQMLAFTILWGAAGGVGVGVAVRHLASPLSLRAAQVTGHELLWLGVLLPLAGVALMVAGPLILLPYRRFNDVLDGATFGGACAVTFMGAEVITNSSGFLSGGLKAPGDETLWVNRLLTLGVAVPVFAAGAIGAVCGAFWLRYRAPGHDRHLLGPTGSPLVALVLAATALVGLNVCELYLGEWSTIAIAVVLAAVAVVALRRVIHLGLCQEMGEREIGAPARCPNCGRDTPAHSFCAQCGVALRALPKGRGATLAQTRLSGRIRLVAVGALFAATAGISVLVIVLVRPTPVQPACTAGLPCGSPPSKLPSGFASRIARAPSTGAYEAGAAWTSAVGVRVRYDSKLWQATTSQTTLSLKAQNSKTGEFVLAAVIAVPASESPAQLLRDHLSSEEGAYLGIAPDTDPEHLLLGPELGYVHAIGGMYTATLNQPPSPSRRVEFAFQAATFGGATVLVEAATDEDPVKSDAGSSTPFPYFSLVDALTETLQWPET